MKFTQWDCRIAPRQPVAEAPVIEVDELMLPTIMLLNQKGYCTEYCCSGHAYEGYYSPYIVFNSFLCEMLDEAELEYLFKELPKPWHIEKGDCLGRFTLRYRTDKEIKNDIVEAQREICDANMKLLDFVNTLPSIYDEE